MDRTGMEEPDLRSNGTEPVQLSTDRIAGIRRHSTIGSPPSNLKGRFHYLSTLILIVVTCVFWQANASESRPLAQALENYQSAISELERTWISFLREQTDTLAPEAAKTNPLLHADPWGTATQETHYLPPISTIYRADPSGDQELEKLDPAALLSLIPSHLRLAELMGIGRNAINWDAQTIDATITANSGRPISYPTLARLRYIFFGSFEITAETDVKGSKIETFRATLDSRSFTTVGLVSTDIAWEIKHFRLFNYSMRRMTADRPNPWTMESLHRDLQSHLKVVLPSAHQQQLEQATVDPINSELNRRLEAWRRLVAHEGLRRIQQPRTTDSTSLGAVLNQLETRKHALGQFLIKAGHQAHRCLRDELKHLPAEANIVSWLQTQSNSDLVPPPWTDSVELARLLKDLGDHVEAHREVIP